MTSGTVAKTPATPAASGEPVSVSAMIGIATSAIALPAEREELRGEERRRAGLRRRGASAAGRAVVRRGRSSVRVIDRSSGRCA